jgi:hypothetical protein
MSFLSRQGQYTHVYHAEQLAEMAGDCNIPAGGLLIKVGELARLGWWCRLVDSHHGSRIKLTFYGPDKKSIISFRAAPFYRSLGFKDLCCALTNGVVTGLPQIVKENVTSDLELLNLVGANIRRRMKRQSGGDFAQQLRRRRLVEKAIKFCGDAA